MSVRMKTVILFVVLSFLCELGRSQVLLPISECVARNEGVRNLRFAVKGAKNVTGVWQSTCEASDTAQNSTEIVEFDLTMNVVICGGGNLLKFSGKVKDETANSSSNGTFESPSKISAATIDLEMESNRKKCIESSQRPSFHVFSRREWFASENDDPFDPRGSEPASYVVINDGGTRCYNPKDCALQMVELQQSKHFKVFSNFHIGEDGNAYEGRGWDDVAVSRFGGIEKTSLFVGFIGRFQEEVPTQAALEAFQKLIQIGICSGKLSAGYKLITFRHIYDDKYILGDRLNRECRNWERWTDYDCLIPAVEHASIGTFPIAFSEEWGAAKIKTTPLQLHAIPAENIYVRGSFNRCLTTKSCVELMKTVQEFKFYSNFFVGEDGMAYEGLGWEFSSPWTDRKDPESSLVITFLGVFNDYLPMPRAILAFQKLIKFGVSLGKISRDYKLRMLEYEGSPSNNKLKEYMALRMDRFSNDV